MIENPTVSVVVATRNRVELLRECLFAIKMQTLPSFEVLVVDDGSNAETLAAYDQLWKDLDDRFQLERPVAPNAPGTGPAGALNRGLRRARGEFVAFCDDDDHWAKTDHLAVGIETLNRHNGDLYFTNIQGLRDGRITVTEWFRQGNLLVKGLRLEQEPAVYEVDLRTALYVAGNHVAHRDALILRRSLAEKTGDFFERIRFRCRCSIQKWITFFKKYSPHSTFERSAAGH